MMLFFQFEESDRVFRSSTSLASSSSGSSNAAATGNAVHAPDTKITPNGSIPKSISFDKTADKDFLDDKKQKKGFFGNLKMSFKGRRKKGDEEAGLPRVRRVLSEDSRIQNGGSIEVTE